MNTKQVEELTGMSRQNIRYYERQGLLEPAREDGNAYRDYSEEDVRRLKLIKMLRMLDMPLKEIENVINGLFPYRKRQRGSRKNLNGTSASSRRRSRSAAVSIKRRMEMWMWTDYLKKMESMSVNGGAFARFIDDYKQVVQEERERMFSFYADGPVNTAGMF